MTEEKRKTQNVGMILILVGLLVVLSIVLFVKRADAQELPDIVSTAKAHVEGVATRVAKPDEMSEFRERANEYLSTRVAPLAMPTAIQKGRGNRVKVCVQRKYDRLKRTWICVKYGR